MSLSAEVSLVWSTVSSALKDLQVSSGTSSVSSFSVEGFLVNLSSGMGSNTFAET
jgi:hypothetical protein